MNSKSFYRNLCLSRRKAFIGQERWRSDQRINEVLLGMINESIQTIHVYIPMPNEIDITPFVNSALTRGLKVYAPMCLPPRSMENRRFTSFQDVETGIFNTQHPLSTETFMGSFDLILLPGLAFDRHHNRIGYGAGYYDKFLADQTSAKKIGLAYTFQLFDNLPSESHDVKVDKLIVA